LTGERGAVFCAIFDIFFYATGVYFHLFLGEKYEKEGK
jgi:hypothetical protein